MVTVYLLVPVKVSLVRNRFFVDNIKMLGYVLFQYDKCP